MSGPTASPTDRRDLLAFLGALCLVLSTLEHLIPKPVPFMRIGLANLPILLALGIFNNREVLLLVLLKVLGQGFVGGTLFSPVFVLSASGSLSAGLAMLAASRLGGRAISLVGVSILGALASNAIQIALAVALVSGPGGWLIGPPFLLFGTVSAVLLGYCARAIEASSSWLAEVRLLTGRAAVPPEACRGNPARTAGEGAASLRRRRARRDLLGRVLSPRAAFFTGCAALPAFLFLESIPARAAITAVFVALALLSGKRLRPWYPLSATLGIVAAHLLLPSGRVLLSLGSFPIASGSLEMGAARALTFVGLVYLSFFSVRPGLPLPGRFGGLLARTIYHFERLLEEPWRPDRRDLCGSLDRLLWSIYPPGCVAVFAGARVGAGPRRTTAAGWCVAVAVVFGCWAALLGDALGRA